MGYSFCPMCIPSGLVVSFQICMLCIERLCMCAVCVCVRACVARAHVVFNLEIPSLLDSRPDRDQSSYTKRYTHAHTYKNLRTVQETPQKLQHTIFLHQIESHFFLDRHTKSRKTFVSDVLSIIFLYMHTYVTFACIQMYVYACVCFIREATEPTQPSLRHT